MICSPGLERLAGEQLQQTGERLCMMAEEH
jgi:hypothetical protein